MANLESGVASYIECEAVVKVFFPVDYKGNAEMNCMQCPYLSSNERFCQLNKQIVAFPKKYIGASCPLKIKNVLTEEN